MKDAHPELPRNWGDKSGSTFYIVTVTLRGRVAAHVMLPTPIDAGTEARSRLAHRSPGDHAIVSKGGVTKSLYRVTKTGAVEGPLKPLVPAAPPAKPATNRRTKRQ